MVTQLKDYKNRPIQAIRLERADSALAEFFQVGEYVGGKAHFGSEGGETFATLNEAHAFIDAAE